MTSRFFSDSQNFPFLIALALLIALSLVVAAGTLLGFVSDGDADLDFDTPQASVLSFLGVSATPSSIFVLITSGVFFLGGFITQWISYSVLGSFISGWIAIIPALILTVGTAHLVGKVFSKVKLKVHTTAVHGDAFVGKTAVIAEGVAKRGLAAQAKLIDEHGQTHYFLVEPAKDEQSLNQGDEVILVVRNGPTYFAVNSQDLDLSDVNFESLSSKSNK